MYQTQIGSDLEFKIDSHYLAERKDKEAIMKSRELEKKKEAEAYTEMYY